MILTLRDPQAKVADVFLMLDETSANIDKTGEKRDFQTTAEDIAHWAGLSANQTKDILSRFVNQNRLEMFADHIVIKNISDFSRFVSARRKQA